MDKIIIDEFLMVSLFGANYQANPVKAAINRAYRDFCRTIRNKKGEMNEGIILDVGKDENAKTTKDIATDEIKDAINSIINDYDSWQKSLCEKLKGMGYTIGQAQKWVNMTMKYLIVLGVQFDDMILERLHVPLDSIIIERAVKHNLLSTEKLGDKFSWSRIDSYDKYISIQNEIRENLRIKKNINKPILWEFQAWNDSSAKDK